MNRIMDTKINNNNNCENICDTDIFKSKWPQYSNKIISGVKNILKSGKVNQWTGEHVKKFEQEFSEYFGINYSVAVCNGTVALELAIISLDLKENDEIIVTSRSFIASASVVALHNCIPVFCDVDVISQNMTKNTIEQNITTKTKAIILVHLAGYPCEMDEIIDLCKRKNIYIIEDCAQAHGAKYNKKYVGTFGDIGCWSFCQDKIISTGGEGGMLSTNNHKLFKKIWEFKDHGKNIDMLSNNAIGYKFVHSSLGSNYRMTEIQAFIGRASLKMLNKWVNIRNRNARILINKLKQIEKIYMLEPNKKCVHAYYKFYIHLNDNYINKRDIIIKKCVDVGIYALQGSCGRLYDEKCLEKFKNNSINVNSEKLMENSIMLQVDPSFTKQKMQKVSDALVYIINNVLNDK